MISVVIPMLNEAMALDAVLREVGATMQSLGLDYELICVNDGSTDHTGTMLDAAAALDSRVIPVHLSRNFGKEAALAAGLDAAVGRAVILLDADLQHPVSMIPTLIERWQQGFDVVEAVKVRRGREPLTYRIAANSFYGLMGRNAGSRLQGSSDFKLLDRQVVDALAHLPERARFLRGLVAWVGFRVSQVPFSVQPRVAGDSKWRFHDLVRYAMRNVVAFSSTPLRMVAWAGTVTLLLDIALGLQTLWNWWRGDAVTGFTTVILVVLGLGGLILLSIGVVALYLAQMYDEQKSRPIYIVRKARSEHDVTFQHHGESGSAPQ